MRVLAITRPDQIEVGDIDCLLLQHGFLHLASAMNLYCHERPQQTLGFRTSSEGYSSVDATKAFAFQIPLRRHGPDCPAIGGHLTECSTTAFDAARDKHRGRPRVNLGHN